MYGEFAREYGALLESAFDLAPVYITARRLSRSLPARASLCHTHHPFRCCFCWRRNATNNHLHSLSINKIGEFQPTDRFKLKHSKPKINQTSIELINWKCLIFQTLKFLSRIRHFASNPYDYYNSHCVVLIIHCHSN